MFPSTTLCRVRARALLILLAGLATLTLTACGGKSYGGSGALLFGAADGITERQISSGKERVIAAPPTKQTALRDPAVSPDGRRVAYVYALPLVSPNKVQDASSDLWIVNRDGSDAKILFAHTRPNEQFSALQWQDDGHVLAVMVDFDDRTTVAGAHYSLVRIDTSTGSREEVMTHIRSFGLSPDAKRIVYARSPLGLPEQLYAANLDGTGETLVAGVPQALGPFTSPRYAPDGHTIAFSAAEKPSAAVDHPRYVTIGLPAPPPSPAAHGLPQTIWIVDAAGAVPRRLSKIKEDDPRLAFSGDGLRLYVSGASTLMDLDVKTGKASTIHDAAVQSYLAFVP